MATGFNVQRNTIQKMEYSRFFAARKKYIISEIMLIAVVNGKIRIMNMTRPAPKPERKKREFKRPAALESNPLESISQETVAAWLDAKKVFYSATVAGAFLHPATFTRLKRMGLKRGVSDILIFDPPPAYGNAYKGVCLEMKRRKGSVVSDDQLAWLSEMSKRGWLTVVAKGEDEAISVLETCGYGKIR